MGWGEGRLLDAACLEHLRTALCTLNIDAAMLTDHSTHLGEVTFRDMLWIADGDEPELDTDGTPIANRMVCPDGHRALVMVGNEDQLMSVGLRRQPIMTSVVAELEAAYDADGPEGVQMFRDAGALVFIPHTEQRSVDYLRTIGIDGMEIFNLHASIDPRIRGPHLGLDSDFLSTLLEFVNDDGELEPDLLFLSFFAESDNYLNKWDTLLAEGQHVTGVAGTDAHENSFPGLMSDGERGDSYRRMMRWFQNYLLVREVGYDGVREALDHGRGYVSFDVFGTPVNFDFFATSGAQTFDMGDDAPPGSTLHVTAPRLHESVPSNPYPQIRTRLLRSTPAGAVEVLASSDSDLEIVAEPGVYRAEARITPHHLRPYLGHLADALIEEHVWIYSNPIYVRP